MRSWHGHNHIDESNIIVIFFCGKIYPIIKIRYYCNPYHIEDVSYCYNLKDIQSFYDKHKTNLPEVHSRKTSWFASDFNKKDIIKYFEKFKPILNDKIIDLHFKLDTPIIKIVKKGELGSDEKIFLNPCLKDIEFFRCLDPYTTFQELSMFISGVMGGKVPKTIEISNNDKIAKHGFDEWSFRKMKAN